MDSASVCPLCESGELRRIPDRPDTIAAECRCGQWELTDADLVVHRIGERPDRWLLSAWIRDQCGRRNAPYRFGDRSNGKLPEPHELREPGVSRKLDLALIELARLSQGFDDQVRFRLADATPAFWCRNANETLGILSHFNTSGLITRLGAAGGDAWLALTADGWRRVEELRPGGSHSRYVFVGMRFEPEFQRLYDAAIAPAVAACGYEVIKVDRQAFDDRVDDYIVSEIRRAGLLVAEFTTQSPNVYFEAGLAMGLGIPVIWCCRSDEVDRLHFNVRQYPFLAWSDAAELKRKLEQHIRARHPLDRTSARADR